MKFGPVAPDDALGATAVHSIRQADLVLKKGTLIGPKEVASLKAAGVKEIVVARLEPGDVSEDQAAADIATAVAISAAAWSSDTSPGSSRATTISLTPAALRLATSFGPISVPFLSTRSAWRIECTAVAPSASSGATGPNFMPPPLCRPFCASVR